MIRTAINSEDAPVQPSVAIFGVPIAERDAITDVTARRGYRTLVWRNPAALEQVETSRPVLVVVDLRHPTAHEAIRGLAQRGIRVVATGPDLDDLTMPGILALGAEAAVVSDRLVRSIEALLPRVV